MAGSVCDTPPTNNEAAMMMRNPTTIVGLIPALKNTTLTTKVNTKFSGKMADRTLASSYLKAENKNASTSAHSTTESANSSSTGRLILMENRSNGRNSKARNAQQICHKI